jgi:hypothetical protein
MVTKMVGELDDWGDADLGGNDFMKLEEGSNEVRIFTKPYQFYTVWTTDATGKQRKVRSAVENCPLVQRGEKPSARWYVGVLDRKSGGRPSILEIGPQIYKQILGLRKKDAWGDPRTYDIDVDRKPKGSQPLYIVSPMPQAKLTEDEKGSIREFLGRVDLVKMTAAPTPEEVREQLGISEPADVEVSDDFDDFDSNSDSTDDDFDFSGV